MRKSTKKDLSKYLKQSSKSDLEKEVKKLYDKFSEVKKYYEMEFTEDTTKIVKEYKKKFQKNPGFTQGLIVKNQKHIVTFD